MRKPIIFSFLLLIFVGFMAQIVIFPQIIVAADSTTSNTSINGAELSIKPISINTPSGRKNLDINGDYNQFSMDWSLPSLVSFQKMGAYQDSEQQLHYLAEATYQIAFNFYTHVQWGDVVKSTTPTPVTKNWLKVWEYRIELNNDYTSLGNYEANISWEEYQILSKATNIHYYSDPLIQLEYQSFPSILLSSENGKTNISTQVTSLIRTSYVGQPETKTISSQDNDFVSGVQTASAQLLNVNSRNEDDTNIKLSSDYQDEMEAKLLSEHVGVTVAQENGITHQAYVSNAVGKDSVVPVNDNNQVQMPISLQPTITKGIQTVTIMRPGGSNMNARMEVRAAHGWFSSAITYFPPSSDMTFYPIRYVSTENRLIKQSLYVVVQLECNVELSGEVTAEKWLGDPELNEGQIVWNMGLSGDTGMTIAYLRESSLSSYFNDMKDVSDELVNQSQQWFEQIKQWLILIGIVAAVGIAIYGFIKIVPMLKRR